MTLRWLKLALVLLLGAGISSSVWIFLQQPAVTIQQVREIKSVEVAGDRLELLFNLQRPRQCPTTVERQLWQWSTVDGHAVRRVVPLPPLDVANGLPDETSTLVSLPVPSPVTQGQWFYTSRTYMMCPWFGLLGFRSLTVSPDVPVTIER